MPEPTTPNCLSQQPPVSLSHNAPVFGPVFYPFFLPLTHPTLPLHRRISPTMMSVSAAAKSAEHPLCDRISNDGDKLGEGGIGAIRSTIVNPRRRPGDGDYNGQTRWAIELDWTTARTRHITSNGMEWKLVANDISTCDTLIALSTSREPLRSGIWSKSLSLSHPSTELPLLGPHYR